MFVHMYDRLRQAMAQPPPLRPSEQGEVRHAAVALVLAKGPQGWSLLMMKRAEREGDPWSGHMSFPGGHVEPGDADWDAVLAVAKQAWEAGAASK